MKLVLTQPIQAHGEEVTELTFRAPVARDLRALPIGARSIGDYLPLLAALASVPPSSIEQLAACDLFEALEWLYPLFARSPATGGPSSPSAPGATAGPLTPSGL